TSTQGSARRSSASRSRARVNSFSRAMWALRASIHSWRETMLCGCMACLQISGEKVFQLSEQLVPALGVIVASGLIEELLVLEHHQAACAIGPDRPRHQRLALGRRVPGPAEHQLLVRHHLAIDAADFGMLAGFHVEADPVTATDADIE